MYEIEKNIPIKSRNYKKAVYPFPLMMVGDSFFVEGNGGRKAQAAAHFHSKNNNVKFSCRTMNENGKVGIRIWRTA